MILIWLLVILFVAGILAGIAARWNAQLSRWIALLAISVDFVLTAGLWSVNAGSHKKWMPK